MRKYTVGLVLISLLLLTGCTFGSSFESQLSKVLSDMNRAEESYRVIQSDLSDTEKAEQALFNETMKLTQEQVDELSEKVIELEELLEKRRALIDEEQASIKKAQEFQSAFERVLKKATEDDRKQVEDLKQAVEARYENHATFVVEYKRLMDIQKEFYEMLADEGTGLGDLEEKVELVNEQNKSVQSAIELFNQSTVTVNSLKEAIFAQAKEQ